MGRSPFTECVDFGFFTRWLHGITRALINFNLGTIGYRSFSSGSSDNAMKGLKMFKLTVIVVFYYTPSRSASSEFSYPF